MIFVNNGYRIQR